MSTEGAALPARGRRLLVAVAVLLAAVWLGLYVRASADHSTTVQSITVRGQIRQFDGPLKGVGTMCRNLPSLANDPLLVYEADGRLLAWAWVRNVVRIDTHYLSLWTCRQEGEFSIRLPGATVYRFELGDLPTQPPRVSARGLRSHGGTYSMAFSVLAPDGDRAVGCFSQYAAVCPL